MNARVAAGGRKVCEFAAYLGARFGCQYAIAIGRDTMTQFMSLPSGLEVIGVDPRASLASAPPAADATASPAWSQSSLGQPEIPERVLQRAVIVGAEVFGDPVDLAFALGHVTHWLRHAPVCVLAVAGTQEDMLRSRGFNVVFTGLTDREGHPEAPPSIAIIERSADGSKGATPLPAPANFRVAALMATYNEEDIIVPSLQRLIGQGLDVYLLDNWSTDRTVELVRPFLGRGLASLERFPAGEPSPYFDLRARLARLEDLAAKIGADWFTYHDADEVRVSPWPGLSLRDAIYLVDRAGFNCIDHTVIEFYPVDDGFPPGTDFESYFEYFDFSRISAHFLEVKTWKNVGERVCLQETGGHEVRFGGSRVYPYKFLLKHYPIRSQAHGERKVFRERRPRYDPANRARGWHTHYDHIQEGYVFGRPPSEAGRFEERQFNRTFLIERLSGIGLRRGLAPS